MTNPHTQITPEHVAQLRARLQEMAGMRDIPTATTAAQRIYTVDEAMTLAENMAQALDSHGRMPITTTVTRHDDGTMTIHVKPHE
ncbi:MAG: hypothetical protein J2P17_17045 [Mycobacterium sp.]|nr:hypothetical protein [Mycobacterium sp.]